jgi:DNA-binding transcriptional LysR family regulator
MRVSAAAGPPAAVGRANWASLQAGPLITLPPENPIQRAVDAHLRKLGVEPEGGLSVGFLAMQISMVEAGFGSAVMPTFAVTACRRHHVRMEILGNPQVKLGFYRVARRGAAESDVTKAFDEMLAQELPSMSR